MLEIDGVLEVIADINHALLPQWYKNALGRMPTTGEFVAASALTIPQQEGVSALKSYYIAVVVDGLGVCCPRPDVWNTFVMTRMTISSSMCMCTCEVLVCVIMFRFSAESDDDIKCC